MNIDDFILFTNSLLNQRLLSHMLINLLLFNWIFHLTKLPELEAEENNKYTKLSNCQIALKWTTILSFSCFRSESHNITFVGLIAGEIWVT